MDLFSLFFIYTVSSYVALGISCAIIGYHIGSGWSLLQYNRNAKRRLLEYSDDEDEDDDETVDLTDKDRENMNRLRAGLMEDCKLVLLVRMDLKMDKGKIAAQCGHATLACYKTMMQINPALLKSWERSGQAKVALKCSTEEEMLALEKKAKALNLCARSILDA